MAQRLERDPQLHDRPEESFAGWGVMSVPFASGHIRCMRRFPAISIPQRGLLGMGGALFEPFDAARHTAADVRAAA